MLVVGKTQDTQKHTDKVIITMPRIISLPTEKAGREMKATVQQGGRQK
jgi:hypothetical protein